MRSAPRRPRPTADGEDEELPPLSPVFARGSPNSSDDAPLSPTPVRTSPIPTLRRLDAVALLEKEAAKRAAAAGSSATTTSAEVRFTREGGAARPRILVDEDLVEIEEVEGRAHLHAE